MARPNQILLTSLTPGIASINAAFTNPSVPDTDNLFIMFRVFGTTTWSAYSIPTGSSSYNLITLLPGVEYEVAVKASNTISGAGPLSNILRATTLTSALGSPLVAWDENGVTSTGGAGTQLLTVNNTGSLSSEYDLDTYIGTSSELTAQVRNGQPCWQSGGGSPNGIRTSPNPPTDKYSQPCTIYIVMTPFFIDGVLRRVIRGDVGKPEIRISSSGWSMQVSGVGINNVGTGVADGRVYVVECQLSTTSSKLRVIDSNGNDSGEVSGTVTASDLDLESATWNDSATFNEDLPCQMYQVHVYDGLGDAASRTAKRDQLLQKWVSANPDLIYPTFPPEPIFNHTLSINRGVSI